MKLKKHPQGDGATSYEIYDIQPGEEAKNASTVLKGILFDHGVVPSDQTPTSFKFDNPRDVARFTLCYQHIKSNRPINWDQLTTEADRLADEADVVDIFNEHCWSLVCLGSIPARAGWLAFEVGEIAINRKVYTLEKCLSELSGIAKVNISYSSISDSADINNGLSAAEKLFFIKPILVCFANCRRSLKELPNVGRWLIHKMKFLDFEEKLVRMIQTNAELKKKIEGCGDTYENSKSNPELSPYVKDLLKRPQLEPLPRTPSIAPPLSISLVVSLKVGASSSPLGSSAATNTEEMFSTSSKDDEDKITFSEALSLPPEPTILSSTSPSSTSSSSVLTEVKATASEGPPLPFIEPNTLTDAEKAAWKAILINETAGGSLLLKGFLKDPPKIILSPAPNIKEQALFSSYETERRKFITIFACVAYCYCSKTKLSQTKEGLELEKKFAELEQALHAAIDKHSELWAFASGYCLKPGLQVDHPEFIGYFLQLLKSRLPFIARDTITDAQKAAWQAILHGKIVLDEKESVNIEEFLANLSNKTDDKIFGKVLICLANCYLSRYALPKSEGWQQLCEKYERIEKNLLSVINKHHHLWMIIGQFAVAERTAGFREVSEYYYHLKLNFQWRSYSDEVHHTDPKHKGMFYSRHLTPTEHSDFRDIERDYIFWKTYQVATLQFSRRTEDAIAKENLTLAAETAAGLPTPREIPSRFRIPPSHIPIFEKAFLQAVTKLHDRDLQSGAPPVSDPAPEQRPRSDTGALAIALSFTTALNPPVAGAGTLDQPGRAAALSVGAAPAVPYVPLTTIIFKKSQI